MLIANESLTCAWNVLCLFLIPVGGGIPGGVVLAQKGGLGWPAMMAIYFVSDVILAIAFEPLLHLIRRAGRRSAFYQRLMTNYRVMTDKVLARYGANPRWDQLVMISFGVDPMTGRAAAMGAGYGFVGGWLIAIAGDMIFFVILMVSTLWLNSVLGDGTWAAVIIMALMFGVPMLWRWFHRPRDSDPRGTLDVTDREAPH